MREATANANAKGPLLAPLRRARESATPYSRLRPEPLLRARGTNVSGALGRRPLGARCCFATIFTAPKTAATTPFFGGAAKKRRD